MKLILLLAITCMSLSSAYGQSSDEKKEPKRRVAAESLLKKNSNSIAIHTKGLHCASCSIGIRKKVSQLNFVNKKQFNKGVKLDIRNLLVVVAIKDIQSLDIKKVTQAITNAGYSPHEVYQLQSGKLKVKQVK